VLDACLACRVLVELKHVAALTKALYEDRRRVRSMPV
jgi:hypothetical protein